MNKSYLFFRSTNCTGCRLCEMACALAWSGVCGPNRGALRVLNHPDLGTSQVLLTGSCDFPACGAPCIQVCTTEAISRVPEPKVLDFIRDTTWSPIPNLRLNGKES